MTNEQAMRCPQCGGNMEVRFLGELRDKRAVCCRCQTEVDLPDSYRRVQTKRSHKQDIMGSHTLEETIIETRHDGELSEKISETLPPELQEILQITTQEGGIYTSSEQKSQASESALIRTEGRNKGFLSRLLSRIGVFSKKGVEEVDHNLVDAEDIVRLAGGGLSPEESRTCPNPTCGARIHKDADRCPWCGEAL